MQRVKNLVQKKKLFYGSLLFLCLTLILFIILTVKSNKKSDQTSIPNANLTVQHVYENKSQQFERIESKLEAIRSEFENKLKNSFDYLSNANHSIMRQIEQIKSMHTDETHQIEQFKTSQIKRIQLLEQSVAKLEQKCEKRECRTQHETTKESDDQQLAKSSEAKDEDFEHEAEDLTAKTETTSKPVAEEATQKVVENEQTLKSDTLDLSEKDKETTSEPIDETTKVIEHQQPSTSSAIESEQTHQDLTERQEATTKALENEEQPSETIDLKETKKYETYKQMVPERKLTDHSNVVQSVLVKRNQEIVASSNDTIRFWTPKADHYAFRQFSFDLNRISSLIEKENSDELYAFATEQAVFFRDMNSGSNFSYYRAHEASVNCLAILKRDRLASGSSDKSIVIWDHVWHSKRSKSLKQLNGHLEGVWSLAALDDDRLASGSADKTIKIWNLASMKVITTLIGHTDTVRSLLALPANRLASGSADSTIIIWDNIQDVTLFRQLKGHTGSVLSLVLMKDEITIASASADNLIGLWDIESGELITFLKGHTGGVNSMGLLNDGRLVSGSDDKSIIIWK